MKYRVGGRMSRNQDASPGRTQTLIPLSRKVLGDKMAIHADFEQFVRTAIPVGRLLEDIGTRCSTRSPACSTTSSRPSGSLSVSTIPIASANRSRATLPVSLDDPPESRGRGAARILVYYGGTIRSVRAARMAAVQNLPCTVHLSGGFGFVYSLHFAAATPNIGPWQEYKRGVETYGKWFDPPRIVDLRGTERARRTRCGDCRSEGCGEGSRNRY